MTICLWDKSTLYADSLVSNSYFREATKFYIPSPNVLLFGSGYFYHLVHVRKWLNDPDNVAPPDISKDKEASFTIVMAVREDDQFKLTTVNQSLIPVEVSNQVIALGSGTDYAEGALAACHDPLTAMRVTCALDRNCGGIITKVEWNETEGFHVAARYYPEERYYKEGFGV